MHDMSPRHRALLATPNLPALFLTMSLCTTGCGVINGVVGDASGDDPAPDMRDTRDGDMGMVVVEPPEETCETCDGLCLSFLKTSGEARISSPGELKEQRCISREDTVKANVSYDTDLTLFAYNSNRNTLYLATPNDKAASQPQSVALYGINLLNSQVTAVKEASLGDRTKDSNALVLQGLLPFPSGSNLPEVALVSQLTSNNTSKSIVYTFDAQLSTATPIQHDVQSVEDATETYDLTELQLKTNAPIRIANTMDESTLYLAGQYCTSADSCQLMKFAFSFPQQQASAGKVIPYASAYDQTHAILVDRAERIYSTMNFASQDEQALGIDTHRLDASNEYKNIAFRLPDTEFTVGDCEKESISYYLDYAPTPQHVLLESKLKDGNLTFEAISMFKPEQGSESKYLVWQRTIRPSYKTCFEFDSLFKVRLLQAKKETQGLSDVVYNVLTKASSTSTSPSDTLIFLQITNWQMLADLSHSVLKITEDAQTHQILHAFTDGDNLYVVTSTERARERGIHISRIKLSEL